MIFMNHSKECDHADYRWQIWAECHTRKVTILGGRYGGTFFDLCEFTNSFFPCDTEFVPGRLSSPDIYLSRRHK